MTQRHRNDHPDGGYRDGTVGGPPAWPSDPPQSTPNGWQADGSSWTRSGHVDGAEPTPDTPESELTGDGLRAALMRLIDEHDEAAHNGECDDIGPKARAALAALPNREAAPREGLDPAAALIDLGYYWGATLYYDPIIPTMCWLRSDGAGSSVPVTDPEIIELLEAIAPSPSHAGR